MGLKCMIVIVTMSHHWLLNRALRHNKQWFPTGRWRFPASHAGTSDQLFSGARDWSYRDLEVLQILMDCWWVVFCNQKKNINQNQNQSQSKFHQRIKVKVLISEWMHNDTLTLTLTFHLSATFGQVKIVWSNKIPASAASPWRVILWQFHSRRRLRSRSTGMMICAWLPWHGWRHGGRVWFLWLRLLPGTNTAPQSKKNELQITELINWIMMCAQLRNRDCVCGSTSTISNELVSRVVWP